MRLRLKWWARIYRRDPTDLLGRMTMKEMKRLMTIRMKSGVMAIALLTALTLAAQEPLTTANEEGGTAKAKSSRSKKHVAAESALARELREMRAEQAAQKAQIAAQQAQIDALTRASAAKDAALAQAQTDTQKAAAAAQTATAQAQSASTEAASDTAAVQTLNTQVTTLQAKQVTLGETVAATKAEVESPIALHYKGVRITPIGFIALEGVYRTRSTNSDIPTPFNSTPYPGSNEGHVSELNLTARQTRPAVLVEGTVKSVKLTGYLETDFLAAGVTSNANQTNSYLLRFRQVWGKAETKSGFAATFGQTWSLATENGKGTDARTEKLPNVVDPSYIVGYTYTRQPALRLQQRFANNAVTLAMSLEQAQTQLTASNAPNNFVFGGAGTAAGLYNAYNGNYANNAAPDVLVKAAFDSKISHFEFGGIARFFRDEYYPLVLNSAGVTASYGSNLQKDTKTGGGVFGSLRVSPSKYVDVAVQAMAGDGVARYGSSQLGDVTAHPDGTLEPVRHYHGLFSLETHPSKKLDVYAYYGAEYNQREVYVNNAGVLVGYGVPSVIDTGCYVITPPAIGNAGTGVTGTPATTNCGSNTRSIQEGMIGYTYKVISDPKYGILRFQMTYSNLQRFGWAGVGAGTFPANSTPAAGGRINFYPAGVTFITPRATNNLVHMSLRYYLP